MMGRIKNHVQQLQKVTHCQELSQEGHHQEGRTKGASHDCKSLQCQAKTWRTSIEAHLPWNSQIHGKCAFPSGLNQAFPW